MQIHVVAPGESLWIISRKYGVGIQTIATVNDLPNPDQLVVGQSLLIPTPADYHMVQPGESLWTIARRHGTTVTTLVEINQLTHPNVIFPGQVLSLPDASKPVIEVNAYLEQMGPEGQELLRQTDEYLTYVSLFSYRVQVDGTLIAIQDEAVLDTAQRGNVAPLMVITNFSEGTFSSDIAHAILASVAVQELLISHILDILATKKYRGVNVDFEYVYQADRPLYNQFIQRLANRLRPQGYLTSSALAPKISAAQQGRLYEAHDYPVHGEVLDFVILMTYEWGWSGGPPMAVAPIDQVRRVLDYALSVIPGNKIVMGMPLYGYDWTLPFVAGGQWARAISPQEAIRLANQYQSAIEYDPQAQSPFFHYYDEQGREHEVWFEDARSVRAKFELVEELGLRGISYWVLGHSFPQNWLLLEDHFQIRKR